MPVTSSAAARADRPRATRIQNTVLSRHERLLLDWMCERLPARVMPDHLTLLGVVGAVLAFAGYAASSGGRWWLALASFGYALHWLGDSLDGSLARHRRVERPLYGYFLDHTTDAICNLFVVAGLGFSPWVRMDTALFALIGYYLLCMYVFVKNHVTGIFELSFIGFGPTELRFALIAMNISMFAFGWLGIEFHGAAVSIYDLILLTAGAAFTLTFLVQVLLGIRALREAPQSVSQKLSSASK